MRKRLRNYEVLVAKSLDALVGQVRVSIESGFALQGGVCVVIDPRADRGFTFYQAIVEEYEALE